MAPAQIPVFLSQKSSTGNGQLCVVVLRLAWVLGIPMQLWFGTGLRRACATSRSATREAVGAVVDILAQVGTSRRGETPDPARITLRTLESLVSSENTQNKRVRFAYKILTLWDTFLISGKYSLEIKRNQVTRLEATLHTLKYIRLNCI